MYTPYSFAIIALMEKEARKKLESLTAKQKKQIVKLMDTQQMGAMQAIDHVLKSKQY